MAKIYVSGNYLIVDSPDGLTEFAKKITTYNIIGTNISIKQNDLKINIPLSEVATYTNEAGSTPYTVATLTTFLRTNTGNFSTVSGGSEATITPVTTSTYTIQPNDYVVSGNNGGGFTQTITLPLAIDFPGRILIFRRGSNADSSSITLQTAGSDTIEAVSGSFASTTTVGTVSTSRRAIYISDGVSKWCALSVG